jgi:hypothetical protein
MVAARAVVVAVFVRAGAAIPATSAHAEDPLLCGLVTPCDAAGDNSGDAEPAPVDGTADIDLDLGLDLDTGTGVDVDPNTSTPLPANSVLDQATLQLAAADPALAGDADGTLGTGASIGNGIVVTGNGAANALGSASAWRRSAGVDATNQFCGVQVVIAATSSASCQPNTSGGGSSNDGLFAVAESVDLCGAQVAVAGSATADCGESAPAGSTAAGSSWTLAGAAARGTVCGPSVAIAGTADTTCAYTAQEAPVPGADPDGTGVTGSVGGAASSFAASSPAAGGQPAQTPNDEANSGTSVGESRGSLPLTGTSVLLFLMLATAVVATGLVALRSSQIQVRHQS